MASELPGTVEALMTRITAQDGEAWSNALTPDERQTMDDLVMEAGLLALEQDDWLSGSPDDQLRRVCGSKKRP